MSRLDRVGTAPEREKVSCNVTRMPLSLQKEAPWLLGAFALCFFADGWDMWRCSYQEYLHSGLPSWYVALCASVAGGLSGLVGVRSVRSALAVGFALPAVAFTRV